MKNKLNHTICLALLCVWLFLSSCQQPGGNTPGSEFMPDMAHSVAYEANHYLYYYNNTWGSEDEYYNMAQPRLPVEGTVARGFAGLADAADDMDLYKKRARSFAGDLSNASISIPVNGNVPYPYNDTEEDRVQAATDLVNNPFPIDDASLTDAKELYNTFCGICHGEKGDGAGYLVREDGGKYPAQPANLLLPNYVEMSNGQYYHAIMYGKNLMGGYSDKLSYEERWQVIHYIRSLQAKELKLKYNQDENTLNTSAIPGSQVEPLNLFAEHHEMEHHDGEDHHDDHHNGEHHGDDRHGDDHHDDHNKNEEHHDDHGNDHDDHH